MFGYLDHGILPSLNFLPTDCDYPRRPDEKPTANRHGRVSLLAKCHGTITVMYRASLIFATAFVLFGCSQPADFVRPLGPGTDWPAYGSLPGGSHYSSANEITPENVEFLELAWVHNSGDFREGRTDPESPLGGVAQSAFQATPILVDDTLYYCSPFNRVFALNPATGEEIWMFDPEVTVDKEVLAQCRGVSSWKDDQRTEGVCAHRIITGTLDARLIALDAETGKRCPDFGRLGEVDLTIGLTEHGAQEYSVTSPPAILGDLVITGAFVLDSARRDVPAGIVRAYDVRTGAFRWGWNPVPPGTDPVNSDGEYVSGTTNVWSIISVDEDLGLVYVPTGNSSPDYYGGDRGGNQDYYSSSIVALMGETGEIFWHYQTVHHDIWDYDIPSQPTLVDLEIDGTSIPALVQTTKMGITFVLDRVTGEPVFPVEERPVPQTGAVEGEYLSPTQPFPTKPAPVHRLGVTPDDAWGFTFWDEGVCRDKLNELVTGPIYTPPSAIGTVVYPSPLGGNNWGTPAVDLERKIMVVNTNHLPFLIRVAPQADCTSENTTFPQRGSPYCMQGGIVNSPLGAPCTAPPWATLTAVDLETGEHLWQRPLGTFEDMLPWPFSMIEGSITLGGPAVTKTGLIFIGATVDHYLRAYDIRTGEELWKGRLPTTANSIPMTYRLGDDGPQFVVTAAGGHWSALSPPGDHLMAFSLPR